MNADTNEKRIRKREGSKRLINLGLVGLCIGLEIGVFAYYWETYFKLNLVMELRNLYSKATFAQITLYAVILLFLSATYGGMRLGYQKNAEIVFSQVLSTVMADMVLYLQLSLMARQLFVPKVFFIMFGVQVLIVIAYVNVANRLYRHLFPPRKLLLIHGDRPYQELCDKFESRSDKYVVTKRLSVKLGYEKLCKEIMDAYDSNECNAVVLGDISVQDRGPLLKFCYGKSIRVYLLPKITDVILTGAEELHVFDTSLLLTREYSLTVEQCFFKRMIDILGSLILIVPAAPIMLITAIVIKLYDGGPVLYKQVRCTKDQREFYIMKFRSMRTDAEKDGVARLASKNDDRITPVGRFIRKCRIDELPQLFNILKGDMSFIGPRPERPEIIAQYLEVMPEFALRMKVKAGLAGFAQIYGKYNTTPYDKLKLDLTYIQNYSIWMDLKLMLLTIKILFWPDSTEGVEAEQVTALKTQQAERNKK